MKEGGHIGQCTVMLRAMYSVMKGRRKRGRPPKKWIDNIKEDVKLLEHSGSNYSGTI